MKVFVVNDTRSYHFGSSLVMQTIERELKVRDIEIIGFSPSHMHWAKHQAVMEKADLVLVNGEGSIHHSYRTELLTVANRFPSALINFSIYKYDEAFNGAVKDGALAFKLVVARESLSAAEWFRLTGKVINVVPDLSFGSMDFPDYGPPTKEFGLFDSVDMGPKRAKELRAIDPFCEDFVRLAADYKVWCTGRFHGITLALMLGKPFTAYASNTHKNAGIMADAGLGHLYFGANVEAAVSHAKTLASSKSDNLWWTYPHNAYFQISSLFDRIVKL
jgi:hypothetical protein